MTNDNDRSTSNPGSTTLEEKKQEGQNKGGQGKENNPGNFANDREKAREAGQKGGQS